MKIIITETQLEHLKKRSFFSTVDMEKGDFIDAIEEASGKGKSFMAYHGSNRPFGTKVISHDNMYFSFDPDYARSIGGPNVQRAFIKVNNVLDLHQWNEELKDKGFKPKFDLGGDEFFTIGSYYIESNYDSFRIALYSSGFKEEYVRFSTELKNCDCIIGTDAGHPKTKVCFVKHKESIYFI